MSGVGERRDKELFSEYRVSVLQEENVLQLCCTTM